MNILLETGLPEKINGAPIYADFRNMIRFEAILEDAEFSPTEKIMVGLNQLYAESPKDIEAAIEGLLWFYFCGRPQGKGQGTRKTAPRAYSFEEDSSHIYSAFYSAYGISLTTVKFLHWWEFMALLEGLPDTTKMSQIMYYRTVDTTGMKGEQKKHAEAMKKRFALPETKNKSLQQIALDGNARVKKRFEEAQRQISAKGG
ncbi:MAG: bacteriophage Gp15 family protein [Oscillospiraceae bacterium]